MKSLESGLIQISKAVVSRIILIPECSANPITVTPIWKWKFANRKHPIGGLYATFFEKFLFKF